ncbi:hypothetical protein E2562_032408 [Oryza meyeriana var. granulata]|uniref:Uncharacterized protein n=1 Tax=Oryza meyeriana var. granulata TaxID=110450 RepID=A0A6G1CVE4_9ORYZ|nr:hypothetical protein E2562_032408 [Oryza meyeriana var. granulata]
MARTPHRFGGQPHGCHRTHWDPGKAAMFVRRIRMTVAPAPSLCSHRISAAIYYIGTWQWATTVRQRRRSLSSTPAAPRPY